MNIEQKRAELLAARQAVVRIQAEIHEMTIIAYLLINEADQNGYIVPISSEVMTKYQEISINFVKGTNSIMIGTPGTENFEIVSIGDRPVVYSNRQFKAFRTLEAVREFLDEYGTSHRRSWTPQDA